MGSKVGCSCNFTDELPCDQVQIAQGCRTSEPIHPILMGQINGERVCGKRADYSFLTAVRPIKEGDIVKCPEGHVPCGNLDDTDEN